MPVLHIFWEEHKGEWPPDKNGRRWTETELDDLKGQLNMVGLSQVSDAIGSLQIDNIEGRQNESGN